MEKFAKDSRLFRVDENRVRISNPYNIEATLFANQHVQVESAAIAEFLELLDLQKTIENVAAYRAGSFETRPCISKAVLTPDFHKGKGIPIGTVLETQGCIVPQAIGNDINCGMRLHRTSLTVDQLMGQLDALETTFRHLFFEGGRNIPMTGSQREALFKNGITGLLNATPTDLTKGIWALFHAVDIENDLNHICQKGSLKAQSMAGLSNFFGPLNRLSRDSQIGSIGGGNHFVEIQYVKNIINGPMAYALGLKPDMVTLMIHTGCVAIGHWAGNYCKQLVRNIYPKDLRYPSNGIFPLPVGEQTREAVQAFWNVVSNAANFAFVNRLFLALMAQDALQSVFGSVASTLIYDAPHNFVWREASHDKEYYIHRKGACSADGPQKMKNTSFEYYGEPVMVPGAMGTSSYLLIAQGLKASLCSASHGAGRVLSRGQALKQSDADLERFLKDYRVITPVDFRRQDIKSRKDIQKQKLDQIKQEAPFAYKDITPVIETLAGAGIATPVAELEPVMTIKG